MISLVVPGFTAKNQMATGGRLTFHTLATVVKRACRLKVGIAASELLHGSTALACHYTLVHAGEEDRHQPKDNTACRSVSEDSPSAWVIVAHVLK